MARPKTVTQVKTRKRPVKGESHTVLYQYAHTGIKPEAVQPMLALHKAMDEATESGEYWPCLNNPYFYTDYNSRGFEDGDGKTIYGPLTVEQVENLCYECPLLKLCYDFAVANDEKYGIWGGIDFSENQDDLFSWEDYE
jgi:hypothetical protein